MKFGDKVLCMLAAATTAVALLGISWYFFLDVRASPAQWYVLACGASLIGPLAALLFLRRRL